MKTAIANLNGEQQNSLFHLSKKLKSALNPLMIICYGHRSATHIRTTAFAGAAVEKYNEAIFDIFLLISDDEVLPNSTLLEIARRNSSGYTADNILIFRMKDVLLNLNARNRFFASVFRKGILLYGNKNALKLLPSPLPAVCFTNRSERENIAALSRQAQRYLNEAKRQLKEEKPELQLVMYLLNKSAVSGVKQFILAHLGIDMEGELRTLLNLSLNINNELTAIFPANTIEEALLFNTLNLSMKEERFILQPSLVKVILERVAKLIAVSEACSQRKISTLLLHGKA